MNYDAIIIGAGVAGGAAALLLARRGLRVLIVDKQRFPRHKACGCCLGHAGVASLRRIGLGDLVPSGGEHELDRLVLRTPHRRVEANLPAGAALTRAELDSRLIADAVAAGAEFRGESPAVVGAASDSARSVVIDGQEFAARVVVVAAGLGGRTLQQTEIEHVVVAQGARIGASAIVAAHEAYPPGTVHMHVSHGGYVGVAALPNAELNVAAALDVQQVRRFGGPAGATTAVLRSTGAAIPPGLSDARWYGAAHLTQRRPRSAAPRLFAVGDAAGYVEPFTGEGMTWGLLSAETAAPIVAAAATQWDDALAVSWEQARRRLLSKRMWTCRLLTGALRRRWTIELVAAAMQRLPALAPLYFRLASPQQVTLG